MDATSKSYLEQYLSSLSPQERTQYQTFDAYYFCADEDNANMCADLVLKGEKRATAGLLWGYEEEDEPVPEIGQLTVITKEFWRKVHWKFFSHECQALGKVPDEKMPVVLERFKVDGFVKSQFSETAAQ